jgi:hypothetical protein
MNLKHKTQCKSIVNYIYIFFVITIIFTPCIILVIQAICQKDIKIVTSNTFSYSIFFRSTVF